MDTQTPGQKLKQLRRSLGFKLKEVEARSRAIAEARGNHEYLFTAGRLSQVENSNSLPSLFKLATLSEIYAASFADLLRIYGIELGELHLAAGANGASPAESAEPAETSPVPVWV